MRLRAERQAQIREIVRRKDIRTQRALVSELHDAGFSCTQATVSRDIADMGLKKLAEGSYILAEDLHLQRMMSELSTSIACAQNLVVVKSYPGTAAGVSAAIDAASFPEAMGSVAGYDTVFVATSDGDAAHSLAQRLIRLHQGAR